MTKTQRNSLALMLIVLIGAVAIVLVAYGKHKQMKDEGSVYIGLFQPNPNEKEFENVVVLSKPTICQSNEVDYTHLPSDVVRDFVRTNEKGTRPIRLSVLEGKMPIVSWADTKRIHEKGIARFFRPPEHRLLLLSRVGFNAERTEAIVCVEISEGTFGEGMLIYLKKTNGNWSFVESRNIWIS